ncbi:MAG TPA: biopolymer transporter ExbD [Candidatus Omnitrophota bacterium]|nr:biopolymer transporter ExbD [Candidatus Omnitrophota bacterium]HOX09369.1 biopolymer transporter ExbD [Candidatus Omnitrophota bacterium]HPN66226.1 biopolymer transporter ExbD [Candidatus Omnitrophota bacterium]HRZ67665.1 biopolymer transporter ExbD [Candidatus Omnitrophota bacterium]
MRFYKGGSEEPGFQMAPMIDCVFLLLIFFMSASSFSAPEAQLNVNLPAVSTTTQEKIGEDVVINVASDGNVVVNEKYYDSPDSKDLPELVTMLTSLSQVFETQPVIIYAEDNVPHDRVTNVLNACAAAKIKAVSFLVPEETIEKISNR